MKVVANLFQKKHMAKSSFIEKTYVVGRPTHWNCLIEAIPMCTYNIRGNNLLIARVLQTRSMAPSLFTMLVFSFVKKYTNKCLSKLCNAGGALHHTCAEYVTATPRNTVVFVTIHPQISKRETLKLSSCLSLRYL